MSLHTLRHRKIATPIAIFLVAMFSFGVYIVWIDSVPASDDHNDDNPRPIPPAEIGWTELPVIGEAISWVLDKITDDDPNNDSSNNSECNCGCDDGNSCSC
ncbi:MAG: hypothetical protein OXH00_05445 [Candidatus Poribacteria bacterium]|nr:hypothetical protein [Candidatus Poribacteria bacterium]